MHLVMVLEEGCLGPLLFMLAHLMCGVGQREGGVAGE
jgi:hypothetical protein